MNESERLANPDRPASYEEYLSENEGSPKAEALFHYFNSDLSIASLELLSLKRTIERAEVSAPERENLLALIADIDKRHGTLQTIALDAIKLLAAVQQH